MYIQGDILRDIQGYWKTITLNFHKSSFLALEFPRGVTQFHRICKGKALFCIELWSVNWQT